MALSLIYKNEARRSLVFSAFSDNALEQMVQKGKIIFKKAGEPVFRKGEMANSFFVIRTGLIKQFLTSQSGQEKTLNIKRPGSALGEIQMFLDCSTHNCECEMLEDGELFQFECNEYLRILEKHPGYALPLISSLSDQIRNQTEEIGNLTLTDARHRLTHYLFSLVECSDKHHCMHSQFDCNSQDACKFKLPISKSVIASLLSIQRETFSRILGKMRDEKIITIQGNQIHIIDLERMRQSIT